MKYFLWMVVPLSCFIAGYFITLVFYVGKNATKIIKVIFRLTKEKVDLGGVTIGSVLGMCFKYTCIWWSFAMCLAIAASTPWIPKLIFAALATYIFIWQIRPLLRRIAATGKEGKGKSRREAILTLGFFAFATLFFVIFMGFKFPQVNLSPGNFFNAEWLKMNLVSMIMWYGVVALGLSALFFRRIFWKAAGIFAVLVVFLVVLGMQPGFMLEGTSHSTSFFTEVPGGRLLDSLMANTEPTVVYPFIPKNMNDYKELFHADEYDVIAVNWDGWFRFGWPDLLGDDLDRGTVFNAENARKMRDPSAHGRSPVLGAKDRHLKRISSFRGEGNGKLSRTFFLMVTRKGGGDLVIFPHNAPKSWAYYGNRAEGFVSFETIRVWRFPASVFKQYVQASR